MNEKLKKSPEDLRFWVGPDIEITKDIVVGGVALVPIRVTPDSLPHMIGRRREFLKEFSPSGRSRYAQLGLEPDETLTQQIAEAMFSTNSQASSGEVVRAFDANVLLWNHSPRLISLKAGSKVFRLFNRWERPVSQGREVTDLVKSGLVNIKGEMGKDWNYAYNGGPEGAVENIVGVYIKIADEKKWIPPGNMPIFIDDLEKDYRLDIDKKLATAPETGESIFWVSETEPEIELGESVDAIIDKPAWPDLSGRVDFNRMGVHMQAHLLEGGRTNWKVRLEVKSPTVKDRMPTAVLVYLAPRL